MNHRLPLRTLLALALAWGAASGCSRSEPPAASVAPPPAAVPVPLAPPAAAPEPKPYETPRPSPVREPTPLPDLREAGPAEPAPKAGRQVQRCTDKGRTIYVDLNAVCAEGPGERVTVFPTAGVEAAR